MRRASIVLACVALVSAAPLAAQAPPLPASSTRGFFAGLHLQGASIESDDLFAEDVSGSGLGILAGFGFTSRFAILADLSVAALDVDAPGDVALGHFDLLARYAFTNPSSRFAPFIEGGIAGVFVIESEADLGDGIPTEVATSGGGVTLGGGVQYYFHPSWAVGAGLRWTSGEFTSVEANNITVDGFEMAMRTTRLNLGITWYPTPNR